MFVSYSQRHRFIRILQSCKHSHDDAPRVGQFSGNGNPTLQGSEIDVRYGSEERSVRLVGREVFAWRDRLKETKPVNREISVMIYSKAK